MTPDYTHDQLTHTTDTGSDAAEAREEPSEKSNGLLSSVQKQAQLLRVTSLPGVPLLKFLCLGQAINDGKFEHNGANQF